jgi:hypothetical protein
VSGFLSHLHSLMVTMSQKSSVPQPPISVSQALMPDSPAVTGKNSSDQSSGTTQDTSKIPGMPGNKSGQPKAIEQGRPLIAGTAEPSPDRRN